MEVIKLEIEGMHCSACAEGIISNLSKEAGIVGVAVNAVTGKGRVKYEESTTSKETILRLVNSYGFEAREDRGAAQEERALKLLARRFFFSLPLFLIIFTLHMFFPHTAPYLYAQFGLATLVQFVGGAGFYSGLVSLWRTKKADMNLLIVLGTSSAYLFSCAVLFAPWLFPSSEMGLYFEGSAAVITFVLLGEWLKAKAKARSSEGVKLLASLLPAKATIKTQEGIAQEVALESLQAGDVCLIKAGEKIPLDGEILKGEAEVDSSHISGESLPLLRTAGEGVIGGSIVVNGYLEVKVLKSAKESLVYEMIDRLEEAQNQKPPIGKLADRIAAVFVPSVVALSLLTLLLWLYFHGGVEQAFLASVVVLIISCPCALGLATPISIVSAISRASRLGILIKNPDIIEKSAGIRRVIFDKTGTLTQGELAVEEARFFGAIPEDFYSKLAALERSSSHPISRAILDYAMKENPKTSELEAVKNHIGKGLEGSIRGERIIAGNRRLMEESGVMIPQDEGNLAGLSRVYVALEGRIVAILGLGDRLREGAEETLGWLKAHGIAPVIVSGDSQAAVAHWAERLGIGEYYAEVLPQEKHGIVKNLRQSGGVAFVGDGVNDALALEEADIGIALSGGTEIAQESGDILLLGEGLGGVAQALGLCTMALKNIKQNLFFAYIYNAILIPVAAGALYPWFGILLKPSLAGAAMAFSSVSVVSNALRIGRWRG